MATPPAAATAPAAVTPPAPVPETEAGPAALTTSSAMVDVLNPEPIKVLEPTPVVFEEVFKDEQIPQPEAETEFPAPEAVPPKQRGKSKKDPVTKVSKSKDKSPEKAQTRKRNRSGKKPKTKPTRRSHRIPLQSRKSGPSPPMHFDLSDEEDSSSINIKKGSGSKKTRTIVVEDSPTLSDEASSSPAEIMHEAEG